MTNLPNAVKASYLPNENFVNRIRIRNLERSLTLSTKQSERCYVLHELARLHVETKQALKARYYAHKCQNGELYYSY